MSQFITDFLQTFKWYRDLSLRLLEEISDEDLNQRINERSLPAREQFIDLGDMQWKMSEFISGEKKVVPVTRPNPENASKEEVRTYIHACEAMFMDTLQNIKDENAVSVDWFGRMKFNLKEALQFVLAHEAMHHGELLSFIFARNISMPPSFKTTWGFERNK